MRADVADAVRAVIVRGAALFLLWWVLTEATGGLVFAALVVPLALGLTFAFRPPRSARARLGGVLRFVPFFLWQSLRGGTDVARRALDPRLPLAPALVEYALRVKDERARVLLANVLSLVPGTVSAELGANRIRLHVLDMRLPIERTVRRLEARVAGIFGETLGDSQGPQKQGTTDEHG